ncbi:hypothetical protein ABPG75_010194 [Micractinium tetrahymenae]
MSRRLALALALVLLAACARADQPEVVDEAGEAEGLPAIPDQGAAAAAAASGAAVTDSASGDEEPSSWHHKKHEKHHHHHDKHHLKNGEREEHHHGKHHKKHGWWHALEKRAEAMGEDLGDRVEALLGDDGALAALAACLAIGAGALAAWMVHRRRVHAAATKRAAARLEGADADAQKGEQAPLLHVEQGKQE